MVVNVGSDEAVYKDGGTMGGEGGAETLCVAAVEVGRPGDVIEVRLEGEQAIKHDPRLPRRVERTGFLRLVPGDCGIPSGP